MNNHRPIGILNCPQLHEFLELLPTLFHLPLFRESSANTKPTKKRSSSVLARFEGDADANPKGEITSNAQNVINTVRKYLIQPDYIRFPNCVKRPQ